MRIVQIVFLLSMIIGTVNAGKVMWDANGKPVIAEANKPVKGCNQGGFDAIVKDSNRSSSCS